MAVLGIECPLVCQAIHVCMVRLYDRSVLLPMYTNRNSVLFRCDFDAFPALYGVKLQEYVDVRAVVLFAHNGSFSVQGDSRFFV